MFSNGELERYYAHQALKMVVVVAAACFAAGAAVALLALWAF